MTNTDANNCLVKLARMAMGAYAHRWRVICRDAKEDGRAAGLIQDAMRLRDLARRWREYPPAEIDTNK